MNNDEYCREIEAYLCRKNDGHLIRIVGPSFERVCGWAAQGIPFKIACEGIDRYFVRYYAKGPRRRPVHIDFCDLDVLDAFEAWRRAVGVRLPGSAAAVTEEETTRRQRQSLPEHLTRVLERLTARLAGAHPPAPELKPALEAVANEVSALSDLPSPFRGEARARVTARLAELDSLMLHAVRNSADPSALKILRFEAIEQLAPFRERLPEEAYARAIESAVDRLLREREQLPIVAFD